jgi:hypothetical protein
MVDGAGASALGAANDSLEPPLIGAVRIPRERRLHCGPILHQPDRSLTRDGKSAE